MSSALGIQLWEAWVPLQSPTSSLGDGGLKPSNGEGLFSVSARLAL